MLIRRLMISVLAGAAIAAIPRAPASAQYCSFPLEWPFCVAGAVVGTAATIATAPFRPYYYPYYPYYYGYYPAYYYSHSRHRYHRHHYYH